MARFCRRRAFMALSAILPLLGAQGADGQTISTMASLSFGGFAVLGPGTKTIVVSPGGARGKTGNIALLGGVPASAGQVMINGTAGAVVSLGLPMDGTVVVSSGSDTMAVKAFTSSPSISPTTSPPSTAPLTGGSLLVRIGATLVVNTGQAPGNYSGSYDVTVIYE